MSRIYQNILFTPQSDKAAFAGQVYRSLQDRRITGYFERRHVVRQDVIDELVDGPAFKEAMQTELHQIFAEVRTELRQLIKSNKDISGRGMFNAKSGAVFASSIFLIVLLFMQLGYSDAVTWVITLASAILVGITASSSARAQNRHPGPRHRRTILYLAAFISLSPIFVVTLLHTLIKLEWTPFIFLPALAAAFTVGYLLPKGQTIDQCRFILGVVWKDKSLLSLRYREARLKQDWLDDCTETIIMPQAVLIINTILGKDKDRLLVEQDSEGLRKLQDPNFTVSTRSEHRIASVLSQMDGGSIALAGPRGAGKTTLLKKFSDPLRTTDNDEPGIVVYVTAPAEYVPRDFIAELLQRLCETYLRHEEYSLPEPIYKEPKHSLRRLIGRIPTIVKLAFRTAVAVAVIAWMAWPVIKGVSKVHYHYHYYYTTVLSSVRHWFDRTHTHIYHSLHSRLKSIWTLLGVILRILVIIFAIANLPSFWTWKVRVGRRKEPALAKSAREYLLRLQVEKSVTWGRSLNSPPGRGAGLSVSKGGTASYIPWTLPELVRYTRHFMEEISNAFKNSNHAVVIGIDEIDRIGSLDHAERFIGEIKAIFGVERCFFLVAVAEDVGSIFAQRATAGRSILENAFDDIIVVETLDLSETRDLLLKRVPGFTDSFVYLVHSLSGGLPRELIRVTRRLVEVNQEFSDSDRHPRLEDLAFALVEEAIVEAIRATRNQMARLTLNENWVPIFDKLRTASTAFSHRSPFFSSERYGTIKELSELKVLQSPGKDRSGEITILPDEGTAQRIIGDFAAFSYFGLTVIDAFSDKYFDLGIVQQATAQGADGSYEELALARAELAVSPESSRAMLRRFHGSLRSN